MTVAVGPTFKVLTPASLDPASHAHGSGGTRHPADPLESAELLKGGKTVGIVHNGSLYRLQATKLGKLILTK